MTGRVVASCRLMLTLPTTGRPFANNSSRKPRRQCFEEGRSRHTRVHAKQAGSVPADNVVNRNNKDVD